MSESQFLLDIQDLVVYYELEDETVRAVNGIDLKLEKGHTLGLVGETGAGKTTTALAMLRIVPDPPGVIKRGKILLDGEDVLAMSTKKLEKIRGKDISMISQDPMTALNPILTIGEQISEAIMLHESVSRRESFKRAREMLELVKIPKERFDDYPHQLSGGMRQRVLIAIALACRPKLLIADEPTTALDVTIQAQVLELMMELKKVYSTSFIMITHNLGIIAETCDEVAIMYAGRIVEKGTVRDVFNNTKHPYTEGLFNSIPRMKERGKRLTPIPGMMPDPANLPDGCTFCSRCRYALKECSVRQPEPRWLSDTHMVACNAYDKSDFHIDRRIK